MILLPQFIGEGQRPLMFIHIPKTGGISILKTLGSDSKGHSSIRGVPIDFLRHYYRAAFVRNPYDRLVSSFFYLKNGINLQDREDHNKWLKIYDGDFKKFVIEGLKTSGILDNQQHFKRQCFYITDINGNINLNFIGKFENIQQDFNRLCEILSIQPVKLRHDNKSIHSNWESYYDEEMRTVVYDVYQKDFEKLGYIR